jgi:hypothetical protein
MNFPHPARIRSSLTPMAACLALAFPLTCGAARDHGAAPSHPAEIRTVANCNDNGPGSLRDVIATEAQSGDVVDIGALPCSTITLTTGEIGIAQDDLVLEGPGRGDLLIDGNSQGGASQRIFRHSGSGTLEIRGVTLADGESTEGYGGCVASSGNVYLEDVKVTQCVASATPLAHGGAIDAVGDITVVDSLISHGHARETGPAAVGARARGGAVCAGGDVTVERSRLIESSAESPHNRGFGGGIYVDGTLRLLDSEVAGDWSFTGGGGVWSSGGIDITRSAIYFNTSVYGGGLVSTGTSPTDPHAITDSTISSNLSTITPAGLYLLGRFTLDNSTVAFNEATGAAPGHDSGIRATEIEMQSSIVSNNTANDAPADLGAAVTGANNLIFEPGDSPVPADTLVGQDPLLLPFNAVKHGNDLAFGSPALDAGNNVAGLEYDQRGPGHPRVIGPATDIGAIEAEPPVFHIDRNVLDFGNVEIGTTHVRSATFENDGGGTLELTVPPGEGAFVLTGGTCGSGAIELAGGETCTVEYTFAPVDPVPYGASFFVPSNGGAQDMHLRGFGTHAVLDLTPATLEFGDVRVGTTPPGLPVLLRNAGTGTLEITSFDAPEAPFDIEGNGCGAPPIELDEGEICTLLFEFSPTATGPAAQIIGFVSSVGNGNVELHGNGIAGALTIAPAALDFGAVRLGDTSPTQSVTLGNAGTAALVIATLDAPGDGFVAGAGTCGAPPITLDPAASCTLDYAFAPGTAGDATDTIAVSSDVGAGTFSLHGTGVIGVLGIAPAALDFGAVRLGDTSPTQSVTLGNAGTAALVIATLDAPGDGFVAGAGTCGAPPITLDPATSCTLDYAFAPGTAGDATDTIAVSSDVGAGTFSLHGTGVVGVLGIAPATLDFGEVALGDSSAVAFVTLDNSGTAALVLDSVDSAAAPFVADGGSCGAPPITLATGASCTLGYRFVPVAGGAASGVISLSGDASGEFTLTGSGLDDGIFGNGFDGP